MVYNTKKNQKVNEEELLIERKTISLCILWSENLMCNNLQARVALVKAAR